MNHSRRVFLKSSISGSLVAVAVGAGLLTPRAVLAAWPKAAFDARSVDDAVKALFGTTSATESPQVTITAPDIAENGSVVPVTVSTSLDKVESISVLARENRRPLAITYNMTDAVESYAATRIKMGKTSDVVAVVKANGKVYSAKKAIKVTLGGCGG